MELEKGMWLVRELNLVRVMSVGPKKVRLQHFGDGWAFQRNTDVVERELDTGYYTVITPDEPEFAVARYEYQKREAKSLASQMQRYELTCIKVSGDGYRVDTENGTRFCGD